MQGTARQANEDGMSIDRQNRFFVVTDGMGGELAGDVASRMAIRALSQRLTSLYANEEESNWDGALLADLLVDTNRLMLAARGTDARLAGMGTTAVIAAVRGHQLHVAGLGDRIGSSDAPARKRPSGSSIPITETSGAPTSNRRFLAAK